MKQFPRHGILAGIAAALALATWTAPADAFPAFARKYETSCATCHTAFPKLNDFGEAFRLNGYQIPPDEEFLIKEEPLPLGADAWKKVWPNSLWPNAIPGTAPISVRIPFTVAHNNSTNRKDGADVDFEFPNNVGLFATASLGTNLSAVASLEFEDGQAHIHRAYFNYNNIRFWDRLPNHALNFHLGLKEPELVKHSAHRRITLTNYETNAQQIGFNDFAWSPGLAVIEVDGIIKSRFRYVAGVSTGTEGKDNNPTKDPYFRLSYKLWGMGLDGSLPGASEEEEEGEITLSETQNWRDNSVTLGVFGYWGTNRLTDTGTGQKYDEDFRRMGADLRINWKDLDVTAMYVYGHDEDPYNIATQKSITSHAWWVQADYVFKPWIMASLRYGQVDVEEGQADIRRLVPSVSVLLRANVKVVIERPTYLDGDRGPNNLNDRFLVSLDMAF